jgi:hypothetical protein
MRVLVACEFSGVVRDAFIACGHDAISCDLLETEAEGPHYRRDVLEIIGTRHFDLMIAHPPCTHLAVSGARWFKDKAKEQEEALDFVRTLMNAPIRRKCIENPISIISSRIRKPDQIIQPHWFGDPHFKATCLWLEDLPVLSPTAMLKIPLRGTPEWTAWNRVHRHPPGPDRGKNRSRTSPCVAQAMAEQCGALN